jgi:hypothetical protein
VIRAIPGARSASSYAAPRANSRARFARRLRGRSARLAVAGALLGVLLSAGPSAQAATTSPWWHLSTHMFPSNLPPGGEATVVLTALNVGDGQASGAPTLAESFPAGFSVQNVELYVLFVEKGHVSVANFPENGFGAGGPPFCEHTADRAQCKVTLATLAFANRGEAVLNPYEDVEMRVTVKNEGVSASDAQMSGKVTGGQAPSAQIAQPIPVTAAAPAFGVEHFSLVPEEAGGGVDVQAGSHPFQLTNTLTLNEGADQTKPLAMTRDLAIKLPAGLVGNATTQPRCSAAQFAANGEVEGGVGIAAEVNQCSAGSMVGVASLTIDEPGEGGVITNSVPVFNMVPEKGEPARFGFELLNAPVILDTSVRTGSDYGVTVSTHNITEVAAFISSTVTFWGAPGDERHDASRGWPCFITGKWYSETAPPCVLARQSQPPPFLTMPSSCTLPFTASVEGFSWTTPLKPEALPLPRTEYSLQDEFGRALGVSGCGQLSFGPSIEAQPDISSASTPTGLTVRVRVPQEVSLGANGLASSSVRDISVKFPEGVTVNPASADGLQACSEGQVGFTGVGELDPLGEPGANTDLFTSTIGSPFCPDASKIGTVKIKVPVIANPLEGSLYLATQTSNPFGTLVASYIVAEDKESGVLVKLPGEASLDQQTGQLTATFENSPDAPLESAEIHLFGGDRAPLSTPARCGTYTTDATFTPWSGTPPVVSQSQFNITTGRNGGPCPSPLPFAPTLAAGTTNIQAGAFSPLTTTISREDGNEDVQTVQLHMPPGVSGILAGIPLCPEARANAGTCSEASKIGKTVVSVGLGGDPFSVTGGQVFLTEGYKGAPFGLSIVNQAKAGPFDLGKVIVRAKIEVDPHTAALTVTTDQIPHILDGIPLQIKHVNVTIDRPGFTFNPTNCSAFNLTGTIGSVEGASSPVSVPFHVTNCATLKFAPKFSVSVSGRNSKTGGAGLSVKLAYPPGSMGTQANIGRVKVELPVRLPSRLTTLQQACLASVFNANHLSCPAASVVGHARVITPLLPVPLEGPAYFVSHGGAQFPDLTIVLKGYGVTVELVGSTFISKKGITSTTFKSAPDVPFNTFELTLPQGRYSALAANGNLCSATALVMVRKRVTVRSHGRTTHLLRNVKQRVPQSLLMPTEFRGQNGAELHQNTKVNVTGCPKAKKAPHRKNARKKS